MELIRHFLLFLNKFLLVYLTYQITGYSCTCYFPIEYQGTFMMQPSPSSALSSGSPTSPSSSSSSSSSLSRPSSLPSIVPQKQQQGSTSSSSGSVFGEVTYSELTIESDAIPPWGSCHKREGANVILKDGTENCMRCFHFSLKTSNILQIHSAGLELCFTTEEAARATCPTDKTIKENKSTNQFVLYRKEVNESINQSIDKVFCPINGRYKFTYTTNNGRNQCNSLPSDLSNCPKGNILSAHFRRCQSIPDQVIQFQCLGDWDNPIVGGDRYIALMDLSEPKNRPKYRCGLYRENVTNGQVYVSLSSDSTCLTNLINAKSGYETFTLTPIIPEKVNSRSYLLSDSVKCRFPEWTQGKWERARVEGNQFKFKDVVNNYRTLASKCIMRQTNTPNDRFIVHSTSQCGDSFYTCVWMKRRSTNILEFQFGSKSSSNFLGNLCDDQHFTSKNWITQGRKIVSTQTPCPITGDYTGVVPVASPGESGFCAKVSSDCNNPDIMFHSVSSCENRSHVFEEREYRCLGNWEEDGILYTFTQRRDTTGYQCFAGKIMDNGEVAYIREAGENCIRGDDPTTIGMKIIKQAACPRGVPQVPSYIVNRPTWQSRPDKLSPSVYHKPSIPPVVKTLSTKPISALPQYIPRPSPAMLGYGDTNPHWYQADTPAKKNPKPASIIPFRHTKMRRNSGSSIVPMIWLIIPLILINRLFGLTS